MDYRYTIEPTKSRWCWWVKVTHGFTVFGEFGGWHKYGTRARVERRTRRFIDKQVSADARRALARTVIYPQENA